MWRRFHKNKFSPVTLVALQKAERVRVTRGFLIVGLQTVERTTSWLVADDAGTCAVVSLVQSRVTTTVYRTACLE